MQPPAFPTWRGVPAAAGNVYRGVLVCFATNFGREYQVAWNHLTGTATVVTLSDTTASQPRQAFKYNAWAFAARSATGLAADNKKVSHGTPGRLDLTGEDKHGVYDGCPAYNIANFMPNGATLGTVTTIDNNLSVASCHQDLREKYRIHYTKLEFTVWNSNENSFTGSHVCVDSVATVALDHSQTHPPLTAPGNFDYRTLKTENARFVVRGVSASPPCPFRTEARGLLGVIESEVAIRGGYQNAGSSPSSGSDASVGDTTHGAGVFPGQVLWDPTPPVQGR